jgi:2-oxoisovalerate dehydrogenase E1 component beta subunit
MLLEHKKAYRLFREEVPDEDYTIPIGVAETKREGRDMTLVTYGLMTRYSLEAAEEVMGDGGVSVEVIDLRTVSPWDKECVLESVRKTGKALIVYEDNISGGFGAEVAATIAEDAFEFLDGPVTRIASPDVPLAPYSGILEEHILPNPEKIAAGIRKLAAF